MNDKPTARVLFADTDRRGLTTAESASALDDIRKRLKRPVFARSMPKPLMVSRRQTECEKAMRMIEAEMLASIARCEKLEREL